MPQTPSQESFNVLNDGDAVERRNLNRRQMVQRLVAGAGASAALPALAAAHPVMRHMAHTATLASAEAAAANPNWTPQFLDSYQAQMLDVLGERIVPNSSEAQCNRFIDLLLSVDTRETQQKFLNALGAFQHESIARYQKPFTALSEAQQNELLTAASTMAPGAAHHPGPGPKAAPAEENSVPEPVANFRDHFENVKGWVSGAFYSSEIGMKELGWTGQVMFPDYPGCKA